jgi:conjugative transfer region protein TrbK
MGRAAKIAVIGVLGGLLMTLAIVTAISPPAPRASAPESGRADARPATDDVPAHCRSITVPDPACDAAWESRRRRFFGQEKDPR